MSSRLVYSPKNHRYTLDGAWVPSVSGIVRNVSPNDGLINWSARLAASWAATNVDSLPSMGEGAWIGAAARAHLEARDTGGRTGTQVHSIAERLIFGEPVAPADPDTGEPYSDDVIRMGEHAARFLDAWDVSPDTALVEQCVFHEQYRYAGRFDLCAVMRGGDRWLVDYKTSPSGPYPDNALQLTGYARASHIVVGDRDLLMPPVDRCAVLWLRPDGYELIPVKSDNRVWGVFRHAIPVAAFNRLRRDDVIGAPLPVPEVA
jgi:hypothetical protein